MKHAASFAFLFLGILFLFPAAHCFSVPEPGPPACDPLDPHGCCEGTECCKYAEFRDLDICNETISETKPQAPAVPGFLDDLVRAFILYTFVIPVFPAAVLTILGLGALGYWIYRQRQAGKGGPRTSG
jgi:hypothetical protein